MTWCKLYLCLPTYTDGLQYPYLILINGLIPALLAGNSVILKPSPQTPSAVEEVAKVFEEAGLPSGVLQYFHSGSPTVIETMVRDPRIALVCFTGSVAGGLAVQKAASDRIVNVGLELGGKDPAYVRSDVDVAWAAGEIVDGAVFNSGQSCCAIERVYVHESIHDEFVSRVQEVLKGYVLGDPSTKGTHVGPVISKRSKDAIEAQIKDALDKGGRDETPANESFMNPSPKTGNWVAPTLLTNVNHGMAVMRDETFGPVIPVMKVSGDEEAVRLMNDSEFGLTASIWSQDTDRAYELCEMVEAGTVFVNRCDFPSPVSDTQFPRCDAFCPSLWKEFVAAETDAQQSAGPRLDRLEELRKGTDPQQIRVRPIRQTQELPPQGLSQIEKGAILQLAYAVVARLMNEIRIYSSRPSSLKEARETGGLAVVGLALKTWLTQQPISTTTAACVAGKIDGDPLLFNRAWCSLD